MQAASVDPIHSTCEAALSAAENATITLSATVSKGTYIRSLARDIAHALGTVGHVAMFRRTRAGPFTLDRPFRWTFSPKPLRRAH